MIFYSEYIMAKTMNKRSGPKRCGRKHSRRAAKKAYRKGSRSKTMKGKKDFTTKKTSKVFNRRKHYQKHAKGSRVVRKPYHKKRGGFNFGVGSLTYGSDKPGTCNAHHSYGFSCIEKEHPPFTNTLHHEGLRAVNNKGEHQTPVVRQKGGSYTIVYPFGTDTNTNTNATSSWPSQGTASGAKNWSWPAWMSPTGHRESPEQIATRSRKQKAAAEHRLHEEGLKVKPHGTRLKGYKPSGTRLKGYVPGQFY